MQANKKFVKCLGDKNGITLLRNIKETENWRGSKFMNEKMQ